MKTLKIPNTELVVSRMAYGCGHFSQPKLVGFEKLSPEAIAEALERSRDAVLESFAKWIKAPVSAEDVAAGTRVLNTAYENGITLFDHADIYGWGKCETVFGEALRRSPGLRDKIVIQSKCGIRFADDVFEPALGDPHRMDFSREHIVRSAEGSLRRLGTDRLDILLLHRPDALMQPEEVAQAFDELHGSGKVRYFGVSNHTPAQIELLKTCVRQPFVVNQLHVSLTHSYLISDAMDMNREDGTRMATGYVGVAGVLDYCRTNGIQVQAWSPLKGDNNRPDLVNPPSDATPELKRASQMIAELAQKKGVTPPAILLAWLMRHPAGIVPIMGTMNPERVVANCAADRIELSREEWYDLFAAAAGVPSMRFLGMVLPKKSSAKDGR